MAEKNLDDEATQYMDPASLKANNQSVQQRTKETIIDTPAPQTTVEKKDKKKSRLVSTAASAGTGVLIGGIAGVTMSMKAPDAVETSEESPNHSEVLSNPELVDNEVMVATGVNDDMSFGEAFAEARAEVGPGGVFEWHGNLYGTYTADEWASMSADEKAEYNSHFAWNNIDASESDIHGDFAVSTDVGEPIPVEVGTGPEIAENNVNDDNVIYVHEEVSEPEIEVLGIAQDSETGSIYAGVEIGGQEAILVDIEGDGVFDALVSDFDGDGEITDNEIIGIENANLTVDDVLASMNDNSNLMTGYDDAGNMNNGMIYDA